MSDVESVLVKHIEQFKSKLKEKSFIHQSLLEFIGISEDQINKKYEKEKKTEKEFRIFIEKFVIINKCEFKDILETVSHLWNVNHFKTQIKHKIESLFIILIEYIENTFSKKEIFDIFKNNKNNYFIMILVEQNIISIEEIVNNIDLMGRTDLDIIKYFYPEIRKYDGKCFSFMINNIVNGVKRYVERNDQNLEFFYKMRKEEIIEPRIIEIIKEDKIEEFISLVENSTIDLNVHIRSDALVLGKYTNLTPIKYSALYGSIAIFKYLYMKEVNINIGSQILIPNIIEYAIQGRNYDIIHILEGKIIKEELNNQTNNFKYLKISLKMHHNEIFEYFLTNYNYQITGKLIYLIIINQNYQLLNQLIERDQILIQEKPILDNLFFGFCTNANDEIVKILANQPNIDPNLQNEYVYNSS